MASPERGGTARPVPSASLLLRNIRKLATFTEQGEIDGAAIYIESNIIVWVGSDLELPSEYATADEVLDLSVHVVIPGAAHFDLPLSVRPPLPRAVASPVPSLVSLGTGPLALPRKVP